MTYIEDLYTHHATLSEKAKKLSREAWIDVVGGPILIIAAFVVGEALVGIIGAAALAWGVWDAVQSGHLAEEIEELEAKIEYAEDDSDDVQAPPRPTATPSASPSAAASDFDAYGEKEGF